MEGKWAIIRLGDYKAIFLETGTENSEWGIDGDFTACSDLEARASGAEHDVRSASGQRRKKMLRPLALAANPRTYFFWRAPLTRASQVAMKITNYKTNFPTAAGRCGPPATHWLTH